MNENERLNLRRLARLVLIGARPVVGDRTIQWHKEAEVLARKVMDVTNPVLDCDALNDYFYTKGDLFAGWSNEKLRQSFSHAEEGTGNHKLLYDEMKRRELIEDVELPEP